MNEYNIGDKVWWATCEPKQVTVECLVCYGKKEVVLILGNGEHVKTECEYCKNGFEAAKGFTLEWERIPTVKEISITGKEVKEDASGKKFEYRYQNYCLYPGDNFFPTKEEAEQRVVELNKDYEDSEVQRMAVRRKTTQSHFSWSIGYYRKQLRTAQKNLEYYSRKITELKEVPHATT